MLQLGYFEQATHHACGGHPMDTQRTGVDRAVKRVRPEDSCLDCQAIAKAREIYHRSHKANPNACDCNDFFWFVDEYVPKKAQPEKRR